MLARARIAFKKRSSSTSRQNGFIQVKKVDTSSDTVSSLSVVLVQGFAGTQYFGPSRVPSEMSSWSTRGFGLKVKDTIRRFGSWDSEAAIRSKPSIARRLRDRKESLMLPLGKRSCGRSSEVGLGRRAEASSTISRSEAVDCVRATMHKVQNRRYYRS